MTEPDGTGSRRTGGRRRGDDRSWYALFTIIEPGSRSLIVRQRSGRSCAPVSRGSSGFLSASVMNPLPRTFGSGKNASENRATPTWTRRLRGHEQSRYHPPGCCVKGSWRLPPRTYLSPLPQPLVSIAQVKPDKPDQLVILSGGCRLSQEWNGHDFLLGLAIRAHLLCGLAF